MPEHSSSLPFDCILRAWESHGAEVKGFLTRQIGNANVAEDLLQEIFLKAMRQGRGFCALDNPRAWLFQVARNALIDVARTSRPTIELDEEMPAPDPSQRPAVDELDVCIARNLQALSDEDRRILQACDLDGQTVRFFGEAQGLSLPAAKARIRRARERLRAAIIRNCGVRFDETGRVCCHIPATRD
ncbi:MAG: sigma-70 family RNA polymerase sigma factor [Betaproteobacteria bacterium]|nr:sigma-70 family RNA polymerase sigma factor [Betaproteobacteria bacterium]